MSNSFKSVLMRTSIATAVLGLSAQSAMAAVVQGQVTAGGAPIEGAIVSIEETGVSASTGRDGSYRFANVPEGEFTLSVSYVGAEPQVGTVTAVDGTPTSYNFALDEATRVLDSVIVSGQRGSLLNSINQQRAADNLVSVLAADALGQLPDQNVAESVRRVPGLSVANDQGEGRFVIIRGLDPSLNATSVNGVRLTAPEADTRAVALDVIDSDVLESITITKSLTPDLDGDGIGGSIDIKTLSAFDRDGLFVKAKADVIYSELSEEYGQKIGLTASNVFLDGRLGVAGSIAYNKRDFVTQNTEGDGFHTDRLEDDNILLSEEIELRYYDIVRERLSTSLNFDYRLNDDHAFYWRNIYNSFEDQEFRYRTEIKAEDADISLNNGIATLTGELEVDRDIKDRLEAQDIWSTQFGGTSFFDDLTVDYQIAYTHAEEEEPNALETGFRIEEDNFTEAEPSRADEFDNAALGLNLSDPALPLVAIVDEASHAAFFSPAERGLYGLDAVELTNGLTEEDELALKIDIRRDTNVFGAPGFVKGGLKTRLREKSYDVDFTVFEADRTAADYTAFVPDYAFGDFGFTVSPGELRADFFNNPDDYEIDPIDTIIDTFAPRFKANENIYAGYIMAQADYGPALITGGFRVEATDFSSKGFIVTEFEYAGDFEGDYDASLTPAGQLLHSEFELEDDPEPGDPRGEGAQVFADYGTERNSYVDFLPSLNGRFDITESLVARAAYYKSIARPSIFEASPAAATELDDEGERSGEVGNPDLQRQQAHNFDFSLEYYPTNNGLISVGFFHKDIKDAIADTIESNVEYFGVLFDEAEIARNLGDASVTGLEFNFQQTFEDILPGAFGGLLVGANYTLIDSSTQVQRPDGTFREIALPRTSDELGNVVIGYDKYGLDMRLALTYRGGYIDELDIENGNDRFYRARQQLDFTAKYAVTDQFQIVGELSNITDEPEHAVFDTSRGYALSQYDEYGYTAKLGVRYTY